MEERYGLQERRQSNHAIHVEVLQVDPSGHLPLDVTSMDLVKRRLKQRHIQMYVYHRCAIFPTHFVGSHSPLIIG